MRQIVFVGALFVLASVGQGAEGPRTYRSDHAVVFYTGIGEKYAKAIAEVAEAARAEVAAQHGLDMPETITVTVTADPSGRPRLFTDGQDRMFLTVRSERDLRQPRYSGIFHLYGICHEIGHLAMYRPIRRRGWMTTAAAEGWAHYMGSRLVDAVYEKKGRTLWPDPYDYRGDGMARLKRQLGYRPSETAKGAGRWMKLAEIVGDKGIGPLFKAWQEAEVDPGDPGAALRRALLATHKDKAELLAAWWNVAEGPFVLKRPGSSFQARTVKPTELMGAGVERAHDDGKPAGKGSIAGGGHAVGFAVEGGSWYLTGVRIHGSRYGMPQPPREDFHVWLCDEEFKKVAEFSFPYASFARGQPGWVALKVTPTEVPKKFIVCVGFNPTATKGVFVSRDAEGGGKSLTGLPGQPSRAMGSGDWLIRAVLDQPKSANALTPQK